jgi:uncharacterized protein (DUF1499 family)
MIQTALLFAVPLPFRGSLPSDFENSSEISHPFKPCPGTPNCVIHSIQFRTEADTLFRVCSDVIREMDPYTTDENSHSLQIEAVFRIPVFGFMDDVEIAIASDHTGSILHVRSSSRVGHSDLGVNRRRVQRIVKKINEKL